MLQPTQSPIPTDEVLICTGMDVTTLVTFVHEGIVEPSGSGPEEWTFPVGMVVRIRRALRLQRDFDLGIEALALAIHLTDEIDRLHVRIRCLEFQAGGSTLDL